MDMPWKLCGFPLQWKLTLWKEFFVCIENQCYNKGNQKIKNSFRYTKRFNDKIIGYKQRYKVCKEILRKKENMKSKEES